jgi:aldose 1-epimerase
MRVITLAAGSAQVEIAASHGGRLATVSFDGHQLLVSEAQAAARLGASPPPPTQWGMFLMAPWAGRVRHGRFRFDGHDYQLPINAPPHAIHGTVLDRPPDHQEFGETTAQLSWELTKPWPFGGTLTHTIELAENVLTLTLEATASEPMPVTMGWHPWWRRDIGTGKSVELVFAPSAMYRRDEEDIATGELGSVAAGPWDDCFPRPEEPVRLVWPGAVSLRLETSCSDLVVFTQPEHAVCVEPQTGPPDAFNSGVDLAALGARQSLVAVARWVREA